MASDFRSTLCHRKRVLRRLTPLTHVNKEEDTDTLLHHSLFLNIQALFSEAARPSRERQRLDNPIGPLATSSSPEQVKHQHERLFLR